MEASFHILTVHFATPSEDEDANFQPGFGLISLPFPPMGGWESNGSLGGWEATPLIGDTRGFALHPLKSRELGFRALLRSLDRPHGMVLSTKN